MSASGTRGIPSDSSARPRRRGPRFVALAALSALLSVAVLAGAAPTADAGVKFTPWGSGKIVGKVTVPGGAPAVWGEVDLYDVAGNTVGWDSGPQGVSNVGSSGNYHFDGLPTGDYYMRFWMFDNALNEFYNDATSFSKATRIRVVSGQTTTLNVELAAAGTITGTATVPGGWVSGIRWGLVMLSGMSHTYYGDPYNEAGAFRINQVPTGDYYLTITDYDNRSGDLAISTWYYNHAVDYASATRVHVVAGKTTTVAFDAGPATVPEIGEVSPGFSPIAGGQSVTVSGWDLTGATSVTFDGVAGTGLSVASDTSLTVTTPAHAVGSAQVVVSGPDGDSAPKAIEFTDAAVVAGFPEAIADEGRFTPGVVRCYQVAGLAGVPEGASGVILNVTASQPSAVGHVRVYPDYLNNGASPAPLVSTVNFEVGRDVANSTTISLPADGKVCAYGVGGTLARLILDVDGYILPGSGITLTTPEKLVDTRSQAWYHVGDINGPVQPMTDYEVQVGGVGSVPSDAKAVMVNITVVDTKSPGHLRMWASDTAMPDTSVVNYAPETKANSQIVALSADGKLTFRSFSWAPTTMSPVQVLIDVTGYIAAGSDFVATVPTKIVETRPAYGIIGPIPGALTPGVVYPVPIDTSVVPAGATAVVLNVTAVQPTNFGHIRLYPDTNGLGTTAPPNSSNLNFIPGRDIPNMVIVQLPADRTIDLYTAYAGAGSTDLVVNIIGYIAGGTS